MQCLPDNKVGFEHNAKYFSVTGEGIYYIHQHYERLWKPNKKKLKNVFTFIKFKRIDPCRKIPYVVDIYE